eukprot:1186546-Prorocentrum_minimum.AAC.2
MAWVIQANLATQFGARQSSKIGVFQATVVARLLRARRATPAEPNSQEHWTVGYLTVEATSV